MDTDNHNENNTGTGDWVHPENSSANLPKVLDPIMTVQTVQSYMEQERNRTRRAVLWISSTFLFAVLLILAVFISVGLVVLRNSKNATSLVRNIEAQTIVYASEVVGLSNKLGQIENDKTNIVAKLEKQEDVRTRERALLQQDLQRFSRWVSANSAQGNQAIEELQAKLDEMTERLREQEKKLKAPPVQTKQLPKKPEPLEPRIVQEPEPVLADAEPQTEMLSEVATAPDALASVEEDTKPVSLDSLENIDDDKGETVSWVEKPEKYIPVIPPQDFYKNATTVSFPTGDKYTGGFKNGLFEGWGEYKYANGDVFEGYFENDMKSGRGNMYYVNGDKYTGGFGNDQRSGLGTMFFKNGDRYVGEFRFDAINGRGVMYYADGTRYSGMFKTGVKHGNGTMIYLNGDVFKGEFRDDLRYGRGIYSFSNGARYIGEFFNGQRHGQGRYIYASGDEFVGAFFEGMKQGEGVYIYSTGKRIKGLWKHDKFVKTLE